MNLLKNLTDKKTKLENTKSIKLQIVKEAGEKCILSVSGVIVPTDEIQKIENGFVFVSGLFASQTSLQEALRQI